MSRPIYRKWINPDGGDIYHYKILPGPFSPILGVSYRHKRIRTPDCVRVQFSETCFLKIPKSAAPITKAQFDKAYGLALKKLAWLNRQSSL